MRRGTKKIGKIGFDVLRTLVFMLFLRALED